VTAGPQSSTTADAELQDVITPWEVKARGPKGVDYARVTEVFKSQAVDEGTLATFKEAYAAVAARRGQHAEPPEPHHLIRRGIVFSHRDADVVLKDVIDGRRAYLYTGRGPSADAMHVGHMVPFLLTAHLQKALDLPLVIQITDDEKFLFRGIPPEKMDRMATENIKDILAFGVDPVRTFIFRNTQYMGDLYPTVLEVQRLLTANAVRNTFGFSMEDSVGKFAFAATQAAPSFQSAFPRVLPMPAKSMKGARCLIPCAVDQDPFFVLTRNIAERIKRHKPSLLLTKFTPALKGATHKMSSSAAENGTLLVTDSAKVIHSKLRKAFSGGRGTLAELQSAGADLDSDVAYQLLFFFCEDDAKVASIGEEYRTGKLSSGAVKDAAAAEIGAIVSAFQERRAAITDDDVARVMAIRSIW
jgi:tryptophanyl-tRNA synthetase